MTKIMGRQPGGGSLKAGRKLKHRKSLPASHYKIALQKICEENYDDDDKKRHLRAIIDRIKLTAENALKTLNVE